MEQGNSQADIGTVLFDPYSPEVRANPYPSYHRLREAAPVFQAMPGVWLLTRYQDVVAALRHHGASSDRRKSPLFEQFLESLPEHLQQEDITPSMLFLDPPDHTRLRGLVNRAFTARVVEGLRPRVQEIVGGLLDAAAQKGEMDVVADLAYPLPVTVISDMLGVPEDDREALRRWSLDLIHTLDPMVATDTLERAQRAALEFRAYLSEELIPARRARPGNDLLSALIAAEDQGEKLSPEELISTCVLLLIAGHETTSGLIGNGTLALLRKPDQLLRLHEEPDLIRTGIEELLRYDSPVQLTGRLLLKDMEVDGHTIPKGQDVVMILGAANRDPDQFPDPDGLDLGRSAGRHVAFGGGIHFCLGAPLARLEGSIAIGELARRFPDMGQAGEPQWRDTITLRGLSSLPVRLRPNSN